jgi:hypothetical protein
MNTNPMMPLTITVPQLLLLMVLKKFFFLSSISSLFMSPCYLWLCLSLSSLSLLTFSALFFASSSSESCDSSTAFLLTYAGYSSSGLFPTSLSLRRRLFFFFFESSSSIGFSPAMRSFLSLLGSSCSLRMCCCLDFAS